MGAARGRARCLSPAAHDVFLLQLEGDAVTEHVFLLAFDAHLGYDIKMLGNADPCGGKNHGSGTGAW